MKIKIAIGTVVVVLVVGIFATWKFGFHVEGEVVSADTQSAAAILGDDYIKYTHPEIGFSLEYPRELEARRFSEGDDTETIVFQRPEDEDRAREERTGFQIFIAPFDDEGTMITPERILRDLPDFDIEQAQEAILSDGTRALIFWTDDSTVGRTREVWFTGTGVRLYQITTYAHLDSWLAKILSTWSRNAL
ncbi:MAG: hypothetical protein HYT22_03340 [Candidatus Niyogibacteria bacterium]|nr:hypothetical protein [Candidatus Niyogibacteria bacterium]